MNGRLHQTNVSPALSPLTMISRLAFDFTSFETNEDEVNGKPVLATPSSCSVADKTITQAEASESRDETSSEAYSTPPKLTKTHTFRPSSCPPSPPTLVPITPPTSGPSTELDCKPMESNGDKNNDNIHPVPITPTSCTGVDDMLVGTPEAPRDETSADGNAWTSQAIQFEKTPHTPVDSKPVESIQSEVVEARAYSPRVSPTTSYVVDEIIPEDSNESCDATQVDKTTWKSPNQDPQNEKKQLESDWEVFKSNEEDIDWVSAAQPPLVTPQTSSDAVDQIVLESSMGAKGEGGRWASRMLITVLKKQPPLHVVKYILSVDPNAAGIPSNGPTPLQIAVENNASVAVVKQLLEACPFSLIVRGSTQDPLTYAKQHRRDEKELIELLQRPLNYWIRNRKSEERDADPISIPTFSPLLVIEEVTDSVGPSLQTQELPMHIEKEEVDNIKILCAQVVKGFKRLATQVSDCQERLEAAHIEKTQQIIAKLQEDQKRQFHRQLLALDMRERSLKDKLRKIERRCMKKCGEKIEGWKADMEDWKTRTEDDFSEWHGRMENEIQVSANFRSDLTRWVEEQSSESKKNSFLFATPLGETNETAPLFSKTALPKKPSPENVKKRITWFSRFSKKKGSGGFPFRRSGRIRLEDTNE